MLVAAHANGSHEHSELQLREEQLRRCKAARLGRPAEVEQLLGGKLTATAGRETAASLQTSQDLADRQEIRTDHPTQLLGMMRSCRSECRRLQPKSNNRDLESIARQAGREASPPLR